MTVAHLNRIATAVPDHDVHNSFIEYAARSLENETARKLFHRMARKAEIRHRFSCLQAVTTAEGFWVDAGPFYLRGNFPDTAWRMKKFEQLAPPLAHRTLERLALSADELRRISHVVVTTCTGLYAPGLDFEIVDHLGLNPAVERTMIGFMGCYAAINALKFARHVVRSQPDACVLVLNLELCTLHLQETQDLEQMLSFLIFGDGCSAGLVSAQPSGFALDNFHAVQIPGTRELITWKIGGLGFDMLLSGQVPGVINRSLKSKEREITGGQAATAIDLWAVHPGGRSVLDAVEQGLSLAPESLAASRSVLRQFGNMSSATVMFVLQQLLANAKPGQSGCAMSFGPGLTAETLLFHAV
jgi:predicted naringenin-chalcone synthase